MNYIKLLNTVSKTDVKEVGGKGASLGELTQAGILVPPGFVITAQTHLQCLNGQIPSNIEKEILKAFDALGAKRVAVRSSAIAEDSKTASWAGQLESYLNISRDNLIENIKKCWNSVSSERALAYAKEQNVSKDKLTVAVVVQTMVESESAGVAFTVNPVTHDRNEIMIEAGFGLGEMVVQGMITPNNFIVDKKLLEIKSKDIQIQDTMLVFQNGENREVPVPENKKGKQVLTDKQVTELAQIAITIEKHYGSPQDIEWAFANDMFYILQSRPITTL